VKEKISIIIYLFLALALFLGNNEQRQKKADFLSKTVFYPFITSLKKIESLFEIKEKNILLSQSIAGQTIKITALENELKELNSVRLNYDSEIYNFLLADIIGYKGNFLERNFIINKGKLQNVEINYPVISNDGIVGKIISVSQNFSVVLPLDHSTFKLGVMSKRTHLQGIMESNIYGNSFMTMIKLGSDIGLGDTIVTSNISTVFPKGFPVGIVTKLIEEPDKTHMTAQISTFIDPASMDQVIILFCKKDTSYEQELDVDRSEW
jgi:rod shape-determining protein MreC